MPKYSYLLLCIFVSACQGTGTQTNFKENAHTAPDCSNKTNLNLECLVKNVDSRYGYPSPLNIQTSATKDWGCQPFLKVKELMPPDSGYQSQLHLSQDNLLPPYNEETYLEHYSLSLDLQCIPKSEVKSVQLFVHFPDFPDKVFEEPFLRYTSEEIMTQEKNRQNILENDSTSVVNKTYQWSIDTCLYRGQQITHFTRITFNDDTELKSKVTTLVIDNDTEFCHYYPAGPAWLIASDPPLGHEFSGRD